MAEMRWLLSFTLSPEQEQLPAEFTLWLRNLEEAGELPPICVSTVDELLEVLLAAWQQRRLLAQPPVEPENHAWDPTGTHSRPEP